MARVAHASKELVAQIKRQEEAEANEKSAARDATMARLAAARSCAQAAVDAIDEALVLFVDPDEDDDGSERTELIETALEQAGMASRALEAAQAEMKDIDAEECEPWDEDSED